MKKCAKYHLAIYSTVVEVTVKKAGTSSMLSQIGKITSQEVLKYCGIML